MVDGISRMAASTVPCLVSQASSLPEEMYWVSCVRCRVSPELRGSEGAGFLLSNCGHIYCSACKAQSQSKCGQCGRTEIKFMSITPEIRQNPQVGHLFCDPAQSLKQILDVLVFQEMHIKRGRALDRQKANQPQPSGGGGRGQSSGEVERRIEEKRQQTIEVLRETELLVKEMRSLGLSDKEIFLHKRESGEVINAAQVLQRSVKLVNATKPGPTLRNTASSLTHSSKSPHSKVAAQQSGQSVSHTPKSDAKRSVLTTPQSTTVQSAAIHHHGNIGVTAQGSALRQVSQLSTRTSQITPKGSHASSQGMPRSYAAQGSAVKRTPSGWSCLTTPQSALSGAPPAKRHAPYTTSPNTGHQFGLNSFGGSAKRPPPLSTRVSLPPPPPPPTLTALTPSQPTPLTRRGVSPHDQEMYSQTPSHISPSPHKRRTPSHISPSPHKRRTPSHISPSPHIQSTPASVHGWRTPGVGRNDPSPFKTPSGVVGHATRRAVPGQSVSQGYVTPSQGSRPKTTPTPDSGRLSLRPRPSGGRFVGRTPSPSVHTPCSGVRTPGSVRMECE